MAPKIEEIDDMPPLEDPEEEVEEFTGEDGTVRRGPDRSFADLHRRRSSSRKAPRRHERRILTTDHQPSNAQDGDAPGMDMAELQKLMVRLPSP